LLDSTPLHVVEPGREFAVGPFRVTPFRVNHSIPDGVGYAIETSVGTVVHTGDFKFDHTPPDGRRADLGLLAEIGNRGVDFLLSDSTRAEKEGYTLSEATVGESLHRLVGEAPGRVIVATFASNIGRVQQVIDAAWGHGRKMVALGRSMEQNTAIALERGYLDGRDGTLVKKEQLQRLPKDQLVVMTTGSQGEPMSGLTRMSNRDHRSITIEPGDTVIVSASPIPGNEEAVAKTIDNLFKEGAMVYYEPLVHCHVSGHGSREELKLMLALVRPRHFIPVHGEYRMLVQHGLLAEGAGVGVDKIFVLENGQVVEFDGTTARMAGSVQAGPVLVDGIAAIDGIDGVVLRDRRMLASDGVVLVALTVDAGTGQVIGQPDIMSRGFLSDPDDPLLTEAREHLLEALRQRREDEHTAEAGYVKTKVRDTLSRFFQQRTKRRPMILPIVMEV
jgi:ribonuclease J